MSNVLYFILQIVCKYFTNSCKIGNKIIVSDKIRNNGLNKIITNKYLNFTFKKQYKDIIIKIYIKKKHYDNRIPNQKIRRLF